MSPARSLILALVIGLGATQVATAQSGGVAWGADLAQAKQVAQQSGKLILLHFETDNCVPCMRLEHSVFNQPSVATAVHQRFVPVKFNAAKSPAMAQAFGVSRFPTDIVMTADGQAIAKMGCPQLPMEYVSKLTQVANTHASKAGATFAQAAAKSPYGPVVNQAYAGLANSLGSQSQQDATMKTSPYGGSATMASASVPSQKPAASTPPPITPIPPVAKDNPYMGVAAAKPGMNTSVNPSAPQASGASNPVAAANVPQLPAGSPPLCFDGYCSVTMKKQWQWKKGDARFGAIHLGRTYLFAGAAERDAFLKDPHAYAPVLSGVDPVLALEQGRAVPGKRQFALEYEGKFYLFNSEQTLNKFWADSKGYANGARQAMAGSRPNMIR